MACCCNCAWGSTPARWWCGPLATTCTWTTRRWGRPPTWRRVWNSWPLLAASCSRRDPAAGGGSGAGQRPGPSAGEGLTDPVEVFELAGASALRRRLQAAAARGLTRFVGRQTELEVPAQALEQAGAGHGQVVALVGEAGVGKSRLVYEFVHSHHTPRGWLVLESASVSYGKATPYFPVVDLLKRYCQVEDSDEPRTVRAKVTGQVLTLDEALQDTIPALLPCWTSCRRTAPFLRSTRPSGASAPWTPSSACCCAKARCSPCCWSLRICTGLTPRPRPCSTAWSTACPRRLLLLVNYRPEYQHGWGSKTYYTQLRLDPLPPASAEDCCRRSLGDDPSLAHSQLLIERTEGNPFFLEESVRTLVETGVLVGAPGPTAWRRRSPPFRCRPRCRRCWRRASTACRPRRSASSRRRRHWHGGALPPVAGHRRAARGEACIVASPTSRRPSSSTRRSCSRSASTPSSTP